MHSFHRLLVFLLVFLASGPLIIAPRLAAAETVAGQLVETPTKLVHDLWNTRQAPHVVVPLVVKEGAALTGVKVTYVEAGGKPEASLLGAFRPRIVGDSLHLVVDFELVREPRVYEVTVRLEGTATATGSLVVQSFDLTLTLPPARLRAIPAITIASERWPWSQGELVKKQLVLSETSRQTRITGLDVAQLDAARLGEVEVPVRFEVTAPETLEPGARDVVTLEADGVFPVGTTSGAIEISAPQLGESMIVPFEVRTKVYDLVIIGWFLGWGLAGWLLRHQLKNAVARAEILAALGPLRERAREESRTHPDPEVGRLLGESIRRLDRQVRWAHVPDIQKAADALRAKLEEAESSNAENRARLGQEVTELERTLEAGWKLPGRISLKPALEALRVAREQLVNGNAHAAQEQMQAVEDALEPARSELTAWSERAGHTIEHLDPAKEDLMLPARIRVDVPAAVEEVRRAIDSIPKFDPKQPFAGVDVLLRATHDAHRELLRLAQKCAAAFEHEAGEAARLFAEKKPGSDAETIKVTAETIKAAARPPALDSADAAVLLENLVEAWRAFTKSIAPHITDSLAQAEYGQGRWGKAMKMQLGTKSGVGDAIPNAFLAGEAPEPEPEPHVPPPASELELPERVALPDMRPEPVDVLVADAMPALRALQVTRGIATAGLLALITWVVYRTSWTGTFDDFTGLAVLAFFSDFTLDTVFEAAAKLRKA
jgi:hypothetical protein